MWSTEALVAGVQAGDRRALAKAITLVESGRDQDRARISELLDRLGPDTGDAYRLGITGTPGAGKSTLIDALGLHCLDAGLKVAVLSVDPSSVKSGGSLLGDKTRMVRLGADPRAFVRPSPTGRAAGGVAHSTPEAMFLCEKAGYDLVIVETVGVGQAEFAIRSMVDFLLLLVTPGGGDELQGIKRGILEVVDCVAVNKADGELLPLAEDAVRDYGAALHLLRARDTPEVLAVSAREGRGMAEILKRVVEQRQRLESTGALGQVRAQQRETRFWASVVALVEQRIAADSRLSTLREELLTKLRHGELRPERAAESLVGAFAGLPLGHSGSKR